VVDRADEKDIDVAAAMCRTRCERAEDECAFDSGQALDGSDDTAANTPGLHSDRLQLGEERACRICAKANLAAGFLRYEHPRLFKEAQLARNRGRRKAGTTRDFPNVECSIGVREKQAYHRLPGFAEK
jgi:hypothetical protein